MPRISLRFIRATTAYDKQLIGGEGKKLSFLKMKLDADGRPFGLKTSREFMCSSTQQNTVMIKSSSGLAVSP